MHIDGHRSPKCLIKGCTGCCKLRPTKNCEQECWVYWPYSLWTQMYAFRFSCIGIYIIHYTADMYSRHDGLRRKHSGKSTTWHKPWLPCSDSASFCRATSSWLQQGNQLLKILQVPLIPTIPVYIYIYISSVSGYNVLNRLKMLSFLEGLQDLAFGYP